MEPPPLPTWEPFELDGRRLVWRTIPTKVKTRPPGWPSHKPAPGKSKPAVLIEVRRAEDAASVEVSAAAMVLEGTTTATFDDVVETARLFWDRLA